MRGTSCYGGDRRVWEGLKEGIGFGVTQSILQENELVLFGSYTQAVL